jgi:hypothetical protein
MTKEVARLALVAAKNIADDARGILRPPSAITPSPDQPVLPFALFKKCNRSYIERVVHQINRTYSDTSYDACAVMIRRLVETLIIEVFEHDQIDSKIKDANGDFKHLKELIESTLAEASRWNLTRNCKSGLRNLKTVGDLSAHSRRYNSHREDIDKLMPELRVVVQELLSLAGMN